MKTSDMEMSEVAAASVDDISMPIGTLTVQAQDSGIEPAPINALRRIGCIEADLQESARSPYGAPEAAIRLRQEKSENIEDGDMSSPRTRRTRQETFRPIMVTPEQLERWFTDAIRGYSMPIPPSHVLTNISEMLASFTPPKIRKYKSETYGRQFLLELSREAEELVQTAFPPVPTEALAAFLNERQAGSGDETVEDARRRFNEARDRVQAAGEATAALLNSQALPFGQKKHPLWHHVALQIDYCARLAWNGLETAANPTPDSPRTRFVASALAELGYRPPKKKAWDEDTISAVLSGKRGPASDFPKDEKIK